MRKISPAVRSTLWPRAGSRTSAPIIARLRARGVRALTPRARNLAMIGADVLEPALGHNVDRTAGLIFRIGLDPDGPFRPIDEHAPEGNGVRPWIDHSSHVFSVPIHD